MSKKLAYLAALGLGFTLASPSFSGEVTGNGKSTPIRTYISAICAFSGLEDAENGGPGVTQTPHAEGGNIFTAGVAAICAFANPGKKPEDSPPQPGGEAD
jgi:hypothetical protein